MEGKFFLNIMYKNEKVKFRITNPESSLTSLMRNLRHVVGQDGRLIFDFESIDKDGAPLDYFFGKEDPDINAPLDQRQVGGLGIFICKQMMDNIEYRYAEGNNILTMTKKIK